MSIIAQQIREVENKEWRESLQWVLENESPSRAKELLQLLYQQASENGIDVIPNQLSTSYINTIHHTEEGSYPGDPEIEQKIQNAVCWNATMMVLKANKANSGLGGHISTYNSAATLFEVGFNHFFKGYDHSDGPDIVYFQGHASPGVYARSFVEGRLTEENLKNFRREIYNDGLSSYPHPRLMPDYWRFPSVSMGLSPIQAIYQARFMKYLENRNLKKPSKQMVWALLGDGEMDEPESVGAIHLATRENLNNFVFVVNCNLQRLDGPVRGNGKFVQEMESLFKGAGWKVIKVLWDSHWDELFEKDENGLLTQKLDKLVDGDLQKFANAGVQYMRENLFGSDDKLKELISGWSDEKLNQLKRGGHDLIKVYNAYKAAEEYEDGPVIILAQTVKGYRQGEAGEASNVTHKQKKMEAGQLLNFRDRLSISLSDEKVKALSFYKFDENSKEARYIKQQRESLGGYLPERRAEHEKIKLPDHKIFESFHKGSGEREVATTMAMVQLLAKLLKDKNVKDRIVPIVPDESRTFGMDSLFKDAGIYAPSGQQYEPVDKENLLFYNERKDGVIIEEGITEAGSMSTFMAAGLSYENYGLPLIPFYFYYSMFGFQRVGDLIWAAADARAKGFLVGGVSGRTTLSGEGLQHQDGQSHAQAMTIPSLRAYDPAFAYELAVIIEDGIERMYVNGEDVIYYLTIVNAAYQMPPMPKNVEDGIIKGMYRFKKSGKRKNNKLQVHLLGSGAIMQETIKASEMLEQEFDIPADIWSITSYKALYDDARDTDRQNYLSNNKSRKKNYLQKLMEGETGVFVAATDYIKLLPQSIEPYLPGSTYVFGTDGFGKSGTQDDLRRHFEVDANYLVRGALKLLYEDDLIGKEFFEKALKKLEIKSNKESPVEI